MPNKVCSKCLVEQSRENFGKRKRGQDGLNPRCKSCIAEYGRNRRKHNPSVNKAATDRYRKKNIESIRRQSREHLRAKRAANPSLARDKYLQAKYGITSLQWDIMYDQQQGLCPICARPIYKFNNTFDRRAASVDHDHKTKRVRGLVCHHCNRHRIGTNTCETAKRLIPYICSTFDGRHIQISET